VRRTPISVSHRADVQEVSRNLQSTSHSTLKATPELQFCALCSGTKPGTWYHTISTSLSGSKTPMASFTLVRLPKSPGSG
jgi:hypothetical protein